jgi:hypothetical protein
MAEKHTELSEVITTYITVANDPEEKENFKKKNTKEKLIDLADALRDEMENEHTKVLSRDKEINNKDNEIANKNQMITVKDHEITKRDQKITQMISDIKTEEGKVTFLTKKLQEEKSTNVKLLKELMEAKTSLDKKETLIKVLMQRLDDKTVSASEKAEDEEPSLLIFVDKCTENLLKELTFSGNVGFDIFVLAKGIENLKSLVGRDAHRRNMYKYTTIVIVAGICDILAGGNGFTIGSMLGSIIPKLKELEIEVVLCELPPLPSDHDVDVKCFNAKINDLNIPVIKTDSLFDKLSTDHILHQDGSYQDVVSEILGSELVIQLKVAKKAIKAPYTPIVPKIQNQKGKSKKSSSESSSEEEGEREVREVCPIDAKFSGFIIGYQGKTISKLQTETRTRMSVIDWGEEGKAVLIMGPDIDTVNEAKISLERLIKSSEKKRKSNYTATHPKKVK